MSEIKFISNRLFSKFALLGKIGHFSAVSNFEGISSDMAERLGF